MRAVQMESGASSQEIDVLLVIETVCSCQYMFDCISILTRNLNCLKSSVSIQLINLSQQRAIALYLKKN